MRQSIKPQNLRSNRGKIGRKPMGPSINRVYESSGPDGKVRGTAQQIIEKYESLARDAATSGDRVAAENYNQHAEHYTRIMLAATGAYDDPPRRPQEFGAESEDSGEYEGAEEGASGEEGEARPRFEQPQPRFDQQDRPRYEGGRSNVNHNGGQQNGGANGGQQNGNGDQRRFEGRNNRRFDRQRGGEFNREGRDRNFNREGREGDQQPREHNTRDRNFNRDAERSYGDRSGQPRDPRPGFGGDAYDAPAPEASGFGGESAPAFLNPAPAPAPAPAVEPPAARFDAPAAPPAYEPPAYQPPPPAYEPPAPPVGAGPQPHEAASPAPVVAAEEPAPKRRPRAARPAPVVIVGPEGEAPAPKRRGRPRKVDVDAEARPEGEPE